MKFSSAQKMHAIRLALAAIETTLALSIEEGVKVPGESNLMIAGTELLDIIQSEEPDITPNMLLRWAAQEMARRESEE